MRSSLMSLEWESPLHEDEEEEEGKELRNNFEKKKSSLLLYGDVVCSGDGV